jgi:hypothetical protein
MLDRKTSQKRVDELYDIIFDWVREANDVDIRDLIAMLEMAKMEIAFAKFDELYNGKNEEE